MMTNQANKTLAAFEEQQRHQQGVLQKLYSWIKQGQEFHLEMSGDLLKKLENAIQSFDNPVLKVALIGGFSEGKTSIVSAWLERLDKSMKIDEQESSDEVVTYQYDNKIELYDTPGLFGEKEKNGEQYKEKTKKYISEAHLILYVLNPSNPIKESHSEDLKWLFRQINLLPRTVFVLSRFDDVADIEDEEDYSNHLKQKKETVIKRLTDIIQLTENEKQQIKIVGVSANPFGEGMDYWLQHLDEFKKISHIPLLQQATHDAISDNGGLAPMTIAMQKSIVQDVVIKQMPDILQYQKNTENELESLNVLSGELGNDLERLKKEISDAKVHLSEFIVNYLSDLIVQTKNSTLETFQDFFEKEIGKDAINMQIKIDNKFEEVCSRISSRVKQIDDNLLHELNHIEQNSGSGWLSQGVAKGATSIAGKIKSEHIKLGRDILKKIGITIKFKPWEAIKWAKFANGSLAFVGLAMEFWDSYQKSQKEKEFQEYIVDMVHFFEETKESYINHLNSEDFIKSFSGYSVLTETLQKIQTLCEETQERQQKFKQWQKEFDEMKIIDGEYRVLS
ncbi:MAG: 50S ribosome-binding GTPase [Neisseriaceae bacterium]|nr:50S ribosome-binding GTPase [Neisseriaceae bacterium]